MTPFVVAISGRIGSGKSTLASRLAEKLNCARASFGDYVRSVTGAKGLDLTLDNLQSVGAELVEAGWEPFCSAVIAQSSWQTGHALVVDGVRHVDAVPHLKRIVTPLPLVLVHVRLAEELRKERIRDRQTTREVAGERHEAHSTERDVKAALPDVADLVVDGSRPVDELVTEIVEHFERILCPHSANT